MPSIIFSIAADLSNPHQFSCDPELAACFRTLDFLGFPGYRVGDDGSVWTRLERRNRVTAGVRYTQGTYWVPGDTWRKLKLKTDKNGYHRVSLRSQSFLVHRLVILAFIGPCPDGMECCHWNDIPSDNQIANLRWATHEDNGKDSIRNGKAPKGEFHWKAKVTEQDVLAIRTEREAGDTYEVIAKRHGIGRQAVSKIARGLRWKHV